MTHVLARRWRWMAALLLSIGLLPWMLALLGATTEWWRPAFAIFCHQLPDRSLSFRGHDMLVCSRCAGIFAGLSLGALLPLSRAMRHHGRALVIGAIALNLVQAASQLALPYWHAPRLLCGLAFGWAATAFFIASLRAEAETETPAPVEEPTCAETELELSDGSCVPVGVPADACAEGFKARDGGCNPVLPPDPCPPGLTASSPSAPSYRWAIR